MAVLNSEFRCCMVFELLNVYARKSKILSENRDILNRSFRLARFKEKVLVLRFTLKLNAGVWLAPQRAGN